MGGPASRMNGISVANVQTKRGRRYDTGKGIPTEYLETIFDRFAQIDRKKQGKAASVGLGLYFCKLVVESHGGKIWAESEFGQGSRFFFTLPNLLSTSKEENDEESETIVI